MNAEQLLNLIEQRGLLASSLIRSLRAQVESAEETVAPQRVLKLLVDKGHLTEFQAKKLLREVATTKLPQTRTTKRPDKSPPPPDEDDELGLAHIEEDDRRLKPMSADDEFGLAPLAKEPPSVQKPPAKARPAAGPAAKSAPQQPVRPSKQPPTGQPAAQESAKQSAPQPTKQPGKPSEPAKKAVPQEAAAAATPKAPAAPAKTAAVPTSPQPASPATTAASVDASTLGPAPLSDGLHELLGEDAFGGEDLSAGSALLPAKPAKRGWFSFLQRSAKGKKTTAGSWDSPLILLGGGSLIVLMLVGAVLFVYLTQGSGDKMFQEAETSYREQSYREAIHTYDKFLSRYSNHKSASLARVRRGLAQLRLATEGGEKLEQALNEATQVLPTIVNEKAFDEAYSELASILPGLAEGFAERARVATESDVARKWLGRTDEALALVNNPSYLPTSVRQGVQGRIESIQETVEEVQNLLRRDERLRETIQAIQEAVAQGSTDAAYQARELLLSEYPSLAKDPDLGEAVLSITAKMGEKVQVGPAETAVLTNDQPRPLEKSVALAARQGESSAELADQILPLLAEGAVYGIRAQDGSVLWRRFVGFHPRTRLRPLGRESTGDAILLDGTRQELQRLAAGNGSVKWRLPLRAPAFAVQRTGEHLVVAEENGRVLLVDPESGEATLQAVLPQGIATTVGVFEDQNALLVVGDHSNLYILAADTLACRDVVYLGHKPDCVRAAPITCLSHLIVVENSGVDFAQLHVLAPGDGGTWQPAQKPLRISDNVVVDPLTTGPHVICLTDRGGLYVFEVNPSNTDQPLTEVTKAGGGTQDVVAGSMLYENGHLWVADVQLTRYRLNLSLGQIERAWADHQGDTFLPWLAGRGRFVFHARQPQGNSGVTLTALQIGGGSNSADDAISPLWTTDMAVAPSGPPVIDETGRRLLSISARGDAYQIDAAALQAGVSSQPVFRLGRTLPSFDARHQVDLGSGRRGFAASDGPPRWLLFAAADAATPFQQVRLDVKDAQLMTVPVAFGGRLLLALDNGQIHLVDPATGKQEAFPFQPPLSPGQRVAWRAPGLLDDGSEFVIGDGEGNLYRVGLDAGTPPLLKSRSTGRAVGPLVSPPAGFGTTVFAVVEQGDKQVLCRFDTRDFQTIGSLPLAGRLTMGPARSGPSLFVATDEEGLSAVNEAGEKLWNVPLAGGRPVGPPVSVADGFFLATTDGIVRRIAPDGNVVAEVNTGEPIAAGPVVQGSNLLVSGFDGTLRILPPPEATGDSVPGNATGAAANNR